MWDLAFLSLQKQEASDANRSREQVGVELYNMQQVLARLQLQLEESHETTDVSEQDRARLDELISQGKAAQASLRKELDNINKKGAIAKKLL